jgi:tetratricopeptide (TPR) repeat protein
LKEPKVARKPAARSKKPEPPRKKPAPPPRPADEVRAVEEFEAAVKLFHKREFARAREQFRALLEKHPTQREICDRARTFVQVCDRALSSSTPRLKDADDLYYQGVVFLNQRSLEDALRMFEKALAGDPGNEKVLYAQASALALSGRAEEAVEALRKAVAANPSNRIRAASDPDFEPLRDHATFRSLLHGRGGPAA